jgi:rhamnosyltransferase
MSKKSTKFISVFIPTFNGEDFLTECIEAVIHQELPEDYGLEILVIDSGSKDATLDILKSYERHLNLIEIPNGEFSHGGTRAKAARIAKGEFILFLTQDATPASNRWLINIVEPFFVSDKVGCVFGRQIPRRNAAATIKREVATAFGALGAQDSIIMHRSKSLVDKAETNSLNTFFSDANSAVRRDLLVGDVPFRDVNYAEDQTLAKDMQNNGYIKAYAPLGAVWHSNEYTARQYFKRKFDEFIGLQESLGLQLRYSRKNLVLGWIRPTLADFKFIRRDPDYGVRQKIKWFALSPFYNFSMQKGKFLAAKYFKNQDKRNALSLETKIRS